MYSTLVVVVIGNLLLVCKYNLPARRVSVLCTLDLCFNSPGIYGAHVIFNYLCKQLPDPSIWRSLLFLLTCFFVLFVCVL